MGCCWVQGVDLPSAEGELDDSEMHWSTDIIAARCAEKLLDVLAGEKAVVAHTYHNSFLCTTEVFVWWQQ